MDDGLSECLRECFYESGSSFTLLLSADVLSKGSCRFLGHTHVHSQSGTLSRKRKCARPWPVCIGTVSGNAEVACAQGWRPARGNRMSPSSLIVVLMLMNNQLRIRCGTAQPTLTLPQMSHSVGPHQITQFERATVVFAPHAHAFPRTYPRQTRVEHAVTKHVSSHIQSQGAQ